MAVRPAPAFPPALPLDEEREAAARLVPAAEPRLALGVAWATGISLGVFWAPLALVGWRLLR